MTAQEAARSWEQVVNEPGDRSFAQQWRRFGLIAGRMLLWDAERGIWHRSVYVIARPFYATIEREDGRIMAYVSLGSRSVKVRL